MSGSLRSYSLVWGFFLLLFNACPCLAINPRGSSARGIADGAGVWVNMWNYPVEPDSYCLKLYANGIRNIFIQTSRSNTPAVCNPSGLSKLINAAHRYQMRVIAWSFDELSNPLADAEKVISAANFRSDQGEKVDGVAANLEKDLSGYKIKLFCQTVRQDLGDSYPLIAVVYSPLNHAAVVSSTPWPLLGEYFSVLAVMSYWHSKYTHSEAYQYTLSTIKKMRELTGKTDLDIHVIGDGMGTDSKAINQFLLACKTGAATSASLYPNQQVTADQLSILGRYPDFFPANARLRLAAYHELMRSGKISLPKGEDPANSINRGQFYQLLVRQFYHSSSEQTAGVTAQLSANEAGKSAVISSTYNGAPVPATGFNNNDQSANSILEVGANNSLNTNTKVGINDADFAALNILSKSGVLVGLPDSSADTNQFLAAAIPSKEAIDTLARVIELRGQSSHKSLAGKPRTCASQAHHRADRFFVQPAYAESSAYSSSLLSYFDAAQIVLLASDGSK